MTMTLLFSRYVAMADAAFGGPDTPEVQVIPAPTAPRAVTGRRGNPILGSTSSVGGRNAVSSRPIIRQIWS